MLGAVSMLGVNAASSFQPSEIPGLLGDWDANNIYTDAGVQYLPDSSGKGNVLSQATAGAQLTVNASDADFNGHKSIQGASGDFIGRTALTQGYISQPYTKYAVLKLSATITADQHFFSSGDALRGDFSFTTSSVIRCYSGGILDNSSGTISANARGIATAVYNTTSSWVSWVPNIGSTLTGTGNVGTSTLGGVTLFNFYTGGYYYLGKAARFLLYQGAHDATQRAKVSAYLTARYGL